ncbi:MAG: hypothetical protein A2Z15_05080 [Chloroflexi bacterium RBG_16_50_11]|nr:MAG: hypothetical protein A2Z15_05080 [Chloroflexi bacterium RBG_16_50_11]
MKKNGKRMVVLFGSVFLVVALVATILAAGCSKPAPAPAPTPTPTPAPTPTPPPQPVTLVFSTHDPENNTMNSGIFKPWFAMLEERTGGGVKVEPHWSGELVALPDAYNAVLKGTVDFALFLPQTVQRFKMDSIFHTVPYDALGWRPSRIYRELYNKYPQFQAEFSEVKPLLLYSMFASHIGTTKKPVRTLEDNKGLKMIAGGPIAAARAAALGSVPVSSTPPETYSFWEKGVADGGNVVTLPEMFTFHWGDVIKFVNLVPMTRPPLGVIMNLQKWNSLPPDIQKIMNDMIPEITDLADKSQAAAYNDALTRAPKELGTEMIKLTPEEIARWVAVDKPVIDKFIADLEAEGLPGKQLYADYLALEKKYAAPEYALK